MTNKIAATGVTAGSDKPFPASAVDNKGSRKISVSRLAWIKIAVFFAACIPLALLVVSVLTGSIGPNPVEGIEQATGEWALRFLLLSLCATPLTLHLRWAWAARVRRMIGLFAFFYASLHVLTYLWLDHFWVWLDIVLEIVEKPFITAGFLAFVVLVPLAVTSNRFAVRRLGKRWKALHKWVYFAAVFAVLHFVWLAKGDRLEPVVYLAILLILLILRLPAVLRSNEG